MRFGRCSWSLVQRRFERFQSLKFKRLPSKRFTQNIILKISIQKRIFRLIISNRSTGSSPGKVLIAESGRSIAFLAINRMRFIWRLFSEQNGRHLTQYSLVRKRFVDFLCAKRFRAFNGNHSSGVTPLTGEVLTEKVEKKWDQFTWLSPGKVLVENLN